MRYKPLENGTAIQTDTLFQYAPVISVGKEKNKPP